MQKTPKHIVYRPCKHVHRKRASGICLVSCQKNPVRVHQYSKWDLLPTLILCPDLLSTNGTQVGSPELTCPQDFVGTLYFKTLWGCASISVTATLS